MNTFKDDILEKTTGHVEDITEEPPLYKVLFYNDDFTPKAFVVELLVPKTAPTLFCRGAGAGLSWRRANGGLKHRYSLLPDC